jgi:hypothetical protein
VVVVCIVKNCHENPYIRHFLSFYQLLTMTLLRPIVRRVRAFVGDQGRTVVEYVELWF